jgi:hypothetical protein
MDSSRPPQLFWACTLASWRTFTGQVAAASRQCQSSKLVGLCTCRHHDAGVGHGELSFCPKVGERLTRCCSIESGGPEGPFIGKPPSAITRSCGMQLQRGVGSYRGPPPFGGPTSLPRRPRRPPGGAPHSPRRVSPSSARQCGRFVFQCEV